MLQAIDLGVPVIARGIAANRALITNKQNGQLFSDPTVRQQNYVSLNQRVYNAFVFTEESFHDVEELVSQCHDYY